MRIQSRFFICKSEIERKEREYDHACGEEGNGKAAEGCGNRFLVHGNVLQLCEQGHREHEADADGSGGDEGFDIAEVGVVEAETKYGAIDCELDEIRMAVVVQKVPCNEVDDLHDDEYNNDERHRLQVGNVMKNVLVQRPGDEIRENHDDRRAETQKQGFRGGTFVFDDGTGAKEVKECVVFGEKSGEKNTKNDFRGHDQLPSFSSA